MMNNMYQVHSVPGFAEPFSSWSHLIGVAVFIYLTLILMRQECPTIGQRLALLLYSFACLFVLSASTIYHLLPVKGTERQLLQYFDHAAIYFMIAASFTAIHAVLFKGIWRWGIITIVWLAAVSGIIIKMAFFAYIPEWVGLLFYLAFGWFGLVSAFLLLRHYHFSLLKYLFYGGLAYTIGAIFEYFRQPVLISGIIGPHELFHIAVLMGMGYHWFFIFQSVQLDQRHIRSTA